jgi:hypothetical protein
MWRMQVTSPLPASGEVFADARGGDRSLRVTWHGEAGVVVLSLWREHLCAGSFRLDAGDVPAFIEVLRAGLAEAYSTVCSEARSSFLPGFGSVDDQVC